MKKFLIGLFLMLSVASYTKPYYSNAKEEKIERVYNYLNLTRQNFDSPAAQSIMDDFTRVVYDMQVDSTLASKEDFSKLNSYYEKRANAIFERIKKSSSGFSESDTTKVREGFIELKKQVDYYSQAWDNK